MCLEQSERNETYHKENEELVNDYSFIRRIDTPSNKDECIEMYLIRLDLVKNIVYNETSERLVRLSNS